MTCVRTLGNSPKSSGSSLSKKLSSSTFSKAEVAIVTDVFDFGNVWSRILVAADDDLLGPAHDVGIRHDALAFDDEPGTTGAPDGIEAPWVFPGGLLDENNDLNDRTLRVSGVKAETGYCEQKGKKALPMHPVNVNADREVVKTRPHECAVPYNIKNA